MKRIVETLLEEGIDESMIHRILDLIEEEYEVVDESKGYAVHTFQNKIGNTSLIFPNSKKAEDYVKGQKLNYKNGEHYTIHGGSNTSEIEGLHSYGGDNSTWGREVNDNQLTKGTPWHKPASERTKEILRSKRKDI